MAVWEILLIGVALSMDAFAVGMTNGMLEPKMRLVKMLCVAGAYALFQFLMPVLGYYCGYAFAEIVRKIAPWLSFAILGLIGGKMIFDFVKETIQKKKGVQEERPQKPLGAGKLLLQALATSIDALAVGVTLFAAETAGTLPFHVALCALMIGGITFCLSFGAVLAGKQIGDRFADKAKILGGVILVGIGLKILIEGLI